MEADDVMRAIIELLHRGVSEALVGTGTDFSGRQWFRGHLTRMASGDCPKLFSVQSMHPPIQTEVTVLSRSTGRRGGIAAETVGCAAQEITSLPVVAIFDSGVPDGHWLVEPTAGGRYVAPNSAGVVGTHGATVASCVAFGDVGGPNPEKPVAACRYLDVNIAEDRDHVDTKSVITAMDAVVGAYPDVRVFNCSFGSNDTLASCQPVDRRERLINMRDLDNFIFARDVLVVVAAGNSPPGILPSSPYPEHFKDPAWQLGSWVMGFQQYPNVRCLRGTAVTRRDREEHRLAKPIHTRRSGACRRPHPRFLGARR